MPADVLEVTKRFMREPIRILVKKEELTLEGIKQFYVQVEKEVKLNIHRNTYSTYTKWIIFGGVDSYTFQVLKSILL